MRPIHLSVKGLHSFREKQEVDFEVLCEGGVFGIFGPTGSGKSSLLDAVTLALYGKIERAANTIQGIMNHAEDQLNVSFTFELGSRPDAKRYRVERTYKKGKNENIRTSTCRLIEMIHEETNVLADKERDVTTQVESILGLTLTDFTRAVVLPQGKFAEFLSLKGADRRQMLQRLFHLEKYGDHLNLSLKRKAEAAKLSLEKIVSEQQGLGDASKVAILHLEKQLQEAIKAIESKNRLLNKKEVKFEHYRQIWDWQEELNEVKRKLTELEKQAPTIKEYEGNLKLAKEADALFPFVEELESILQEQKTWTEKSIELQTATAQTRSVVDETIEKVRSIKSERADKEPGLYERLQQLKYAKEQEIERDEKAQSLSNGKENLANNEEELQTVEKNLIQLKGKKKQAIERQAGIKKEIEEKTISVEERNRLRDALALKQEIKRIIAAKEELVKERNSLSIYEQRVNDEIAKLEKQRKNSRQNIGYLLQHTETMFNRVCEHERVIERAKDSIEQSLKDASQKQKDLELHALSARIAEQLKSGEACPVCGSKEHPSPVEQTKESNDYKKVVSELETILNSMKDEERAIQYCKKDLENLFEAIRDYVGKDEFSDHEIAATTFDPIHNSLQSISDLKDYLKLLVTETKGFKQDVIELKEKRGKYTSSFVNSDKQLLESRSSLNTCLRDLAKVEEKIQENEQTMAEYSQRWSDSFETFEFERVEQLQKEMEEAEQQVIDLNQRYDKSVSYLIDVDERITQASDHFQSLKLKVTEMTSEVASIEKRWSELNQKLLEACGKEKADNLYQQVQTQIDGWKQKEEKAQIEADSQSLKLQGLEKETEVAKSTLQNIETRLKNANQKWTAKTEGTSFFTKEQVKEAIVSNQQQIDWENEIEQFHLQQRNHLYDENRLFGLLNNKEVSDHEWEQVKEELKEAKHEKEIAVSEKAKFDSELTELKKRAEKFESLEANRLEKEELSERLGKLQAVFRGNSFVEFIAEEQLNQVARDASQRLGELTRQRYALEVDSTGGFVIRDDANGGVRRPVTSLSGGETFLTSLSLALSLSAQIQLQGEYPLEFFFLDEGFGTLDQSLLDTVISALERLQMQRVSVGVISHVPELRARLPRKLIVDPATPAGKGSTVSIEKL